MSGSTLDRNQIEEKIVTKAVEDPAFMQNLLNNPQAGKAAIEAEVGQKLPADFEVRVVQETDKIAYIVVPLVVPQQGELSEEQLEAVAGGGGCTQGISVSVSCKLGSICVPGGTNKGW